MKGGESGGRVVGIILKVSTYIRTRTRDAHEMKFHGLNFQACSKLTTLQPAVQLSSASIFLRACRANLWAVIWGPASINANLNDTNTVIS